MTLATLARVGVVLVIGLTSRAVVAAPVVFTTSDTELLADTDNQGWYTNRGEHLAQNDNYLAGNNGFDTFRNFFLFDLSTLDLTGLTIASATLEIRRYSAGVIDEDYVFDYGLFDVSTDATTLMSDHSSPLPNPEGMAIYGDLGTGASYGSLAVDPDVGDGDDLLVFALTPAALADIAAAAGGFFAIGGSIQNVANSSTIHGGSGGETMAPPPFVRDPGIQRLVIDVVPEPGTLLLVGSGLVALARHRRMRSRRA
jgi:PEP-CTERM motif